MSDPAAARRSITAVFLVNGTCMGAWAANIPAIKQRLDLGDGALGAALLTMAFGAILAMMMAGPMNDRIGSRHASRVSAAMLCLLLPLPALVPSFAALLAVIFLFGMANGTMDVSMNAHGVAVEKALARPVMSSLHAAFSIGGIAAAAVAGIAFHLGSTALLNLAGLALAGGALTAWAWSGLLPAAADRTGGGAKIALPRGPLLPIAAMAMIAMVCEGAMFDWAAVYLKEGLEASKGTAALGFGVFSAAMAAMRLVGDRLVTRFGRSTVLRVSAFAALAGYGIALGPPWLWSALLGYALIGLGVANIVPILFSAGGSTAGIGSGTGIAAVATAGYGGALLGPALIGGLAGATSLRLALAVAAAFLVVLLLRPIDRRPARARSGAPASG